MAEPDPRHPGNSAPNKQHLTRWEILPEASAILFSIRHLMVSRVRGQFSSFRGDLVYDHHLEQPAGVMVEIDAASVDTGQVQRDIHLRSGDFFDVENYPQIRFATRHVDTMGGNRYLVYGDLRILRETRDVVLDVAFKGITEHPDGTMRASFSATTEINRRDFGLTWNRRVEAGGVMVGDKVQIQLEIEAIRRG